MKEFSLDARERVKHRLDLFGNYGEMYSDEQFVAQEMG